MQYQQQQQEEEQMYQQQLEQQQYEQQMQQQMQYEEHSSMTQQVIEESTMSEESAMLQQQQQLELERQQRQQQQEMEMQKAKMSMNEEEFKQHQKMKRREAEAQEEVRQALTKQREAKMKAMRDAQPKQPVEISVIAGDGKQVRIQLGGEQEDSRKQVAEAAGLKHVPLPDFDDNNGNAAWAGSLKKTPKSKMMSGRGEEEMEGENPWSGSLRHVKGPAKNKKHDEKEDMHGGAPWMGTLRHVVHDNKVVKNYGVNQQQSKRYPDEDAGNPYESLGGSQSKPAFPLTPAAIINGAVMSRDDMARMEEEEEVARIRSNIGSKTVSTALLQVLMPNMKAPPQDK